MGKNWIEKTTPNWQYTHVQDSLKPGQVRVNNFRFLSMTKCSSCSKPKQQSMTHSVDLRYVEHYKVMHYLLFMFRDRP